MAVSELVQSASEELMRIHRDLKPTVIERLGLTAALESLVREIRKQSPFEVRTELDFIDRGEVSFDVALGIYRIAQESLTNIAKHAGAGHVRIRFEKKDNSVILTIDDDGRGLQRDAETEPTGLGLIGMRERALAIGGVIEVISNEGDGTAVRLIVPLPATEKHEKQ